MSVIQNSVSNTIKNGTIRIFQMDVNMFFVGLFGALLFGAIANILARYWISRDAAVAITTAIAVLLLVAIFPERARISIITAQMLLLGAAIGSTNFVVRYYGEKIHISYSGILDCAFFFLNGAILAPIYEEVIMRRFMFAGATRWIGGLMSAILVSSIFALAHSNMMGYAFFFSLLLCLFTHIGISTFDRAVFHGAHNLVVQALYFFGGLHLGIR